ncbi:hypothetical protein KIPB_006011, partial [Kipferlia bialata]
PGVPFLGTPVLTGTRSIGGEGETEGERGRDRVCQYEYTWVDAQYVTERVYILRHTLSDSDLLCDACGLIPCDSDSDSDSDSLVLDPKLLVGEGEGSDTEASSPGSPVSPSPLPSLSPSLSPAVPSVLPSPAPLQPSLTDVVPIICSTTRLDSLILSLALTSLGATPVSLSPCLPQQFFPHSDSKGVERKRETERERDAESESEGGHGRRLSISSARKEREREREKGIAPPDMVRVRGVDMGHRQAIRSVRHQIDACGSDVTCVVTDWTHLQICLGVVASGRSTVRDIILLDSDAHSWPSIVSHLSGRQEVRCLSSLCNSDVCPSISHTSPSVHIPTSNKGRERGRGRDSPALGLVTPSTCSTPEMHTVSHADIIQASKALDVRLNLKYGGDSVREGEGEREREVASEGTGAIPMPLSPLLRKKGDHREAQAARTKSLLHSSPYTADTLLLSMSLSPSPSSMTWPSVLYAASQRTTRVALPDPCHSDALGSLLLSVPASAPYPLYPRNTTIERDREGEREREAEATSPREREREREPCMSSVSAPLSTISESMEGDREGDRERTVAVHSTPSIRGGGEREGRSVFQPTPLKERRGSFGGRRLSVGWLDGGRERGRERGRDSDADRDRAYLHVARSPRASILDRQSQAYGASGVSLSVTSPPPRAEGAVEVLTSPAVCMSIHSPLAPLALCHAARASVVVVGEAALLGIHRLKTQTIQSGLLRGYSASPDSSPMGATPSACFKPLYAVLRRCRYRGAAVDKARQYMLKGSDTSSDKGPASLADCVRCLLVEHSADTMGLGAICTRDAKYKTPLHRALRFAAGMVASDVVSLLPILGQIKGEARGERERERRTTPRVQGKTSVASPLPPPTLSCLFSGFRPQHWNSIGNTFVTGTPASLSLLPREGAPHGVYSLSLSSSASAGHCSPVVANAEPSTARSQEKSTDGGDIVDKQRLRYLGRGGVVYVPDKKGAVFSLPVDGKRQGVIPVSLPSLAGLIHSLSLSPIEEEREKGEEEEERVEVPQYPVLDAWFERPPPSNKEGREREEEEEGEEDVPVPFLDPLTPMAKRTSNRSRRERGRERETAVAEESVLGEIPTLHIVLARDSETQGGEGEREVQEYISRLRDTLLKGFKRYRIPKALLPSGIVVDRDIRGY